MRTSYSQIHRAEECLRKYAFGACDRLWEPQRKAGEEGETLHALNEAYVKYGMAFPDTRLGRLAALGAEHLPSRADAPECEVQGTVTYGAHEFTVRADALWVGPCGPILMDYKTVAHFGWALNGARLRMDLQAVIGSYYAMKKFEAEEATAVWLYYRKPDEKNPDDVGEVRAVETVIEMESALRVLRQKQGVIGQMEGLQRNPTRALNVVGNEQSCKNYGGCWYRHKCFPDTWTLSEDGKKAVERGPAVEYREDRRARV